MTVNLHALFEQAILMDSNSQLRGASTHPNNINLNEIITKLEPSLLLADITRSTSITGFSDLNYPVWISIRPNSYTLSQSSGKSISHVSALIGSIMEAFELFYSEQYNPKDTIELSLDEIAQTSLKYLNPHEFPYLTDLYSDKQKLSWTSCKKLNLSKGDTTEKDDDMYAYIPVDFVRLDYRKDSTVHFLTNTSNGLASGFSFNEACAQALMEAVERHSTTTSILTNSIKKVDPLKIPSSCQNLIRQIESLGYSTKITDCTLFKKLPTFMFEFIPSKTHAKFSGGTGWGCHISPEVALTRAIIEANQARTILISGSRDDLGKPAYLSSHLRNMTSKEFYAGYEILPYSEVDFAIHDDNKPLACYLPEIYAELKNYGVRNIYFTELAPNNSPIHVVRLHIPKFEGYMSKGYRAVKKELRSGLVTKSPFGMKDRLIGSAQASLVRLNAGGTCT